MALILFLLGMAIGALGNRAWGAEGYPRWLGVALMTLGCIMVNPSLLLFFPVVAGLIYFFRFWETGETWLAATAGRNIWAAMGRGATIIPLVLFAHLLTGSSVLVGLFFPIIALFYYAAGKIYPKKCGEIGELLAGAYLVATVGVWGA